MTGLNDETPLLRPDPNKNILAAAKSEPTRKHTTQKPADEEEIPNHSPDPTTENPPESNTKGIKGVISVLILGCFIANADNSILLATYSTISSETGNLDNGSWLITTFMLAVCAIQPTYGKLSQLYGSKATLITAYSLFTLGCALSGAGTRFWHVAAGRAIAGLGAAGMTSLVSVLIAEKVELRDVATWRSYVNVASTVGRSAGAPIGGLLADGIGWRWSFWAQCPLTVIAIGLVAWRLDGQPPPAVEDDVDNEAKTTTTVKGKLRRIDFIGSVSLALAIIGFLLVLDLGGQKLPWTHPTVWILFALGCLFSIAFALVEAYVAPEPIFPLRLLVHRDVISAYLPNVLLTAAQFAVMYTIPLYFQITARATITNAGAHLFPAVCGNAIGGLVSGFVIRRTASYKTLTTIGTLSSITCYLLLSFLWRGNTNIWESLYIVPGGFGVGVLSSTTFVALAAGIEESQMAIAGTGWYLCNNIGMLVGASLASNVMLTTLKSELRDRLRGWEDGEVVAGKAVRDLEFVNRLGGGLRDVVVKCYVQSFEYTHVMSLISRKRGAAQLSSASPPKTKTWVLITSPRQPQFGQAVQFTRTPQNHVVHETASLCSIAAVADETAAIAQPPGEPLLEESQAIRSLQPKDDSTWADWPICIGLDDWPVRPPATVLAFV
ncbi:MAG: hypothetical protein Q9168_005942 [Polycauliona sp. 1 TL-2023]